MFTIFLRIRFFVASFYRQFSSFFFSLLKGLGFNFGTQKTGYPLVRFAAQTVVVSVLAMALWVGSIGTYTQSAQAADNLDARPYEAEAVRQSRNPVSRSNGVSSVAPSGQSQAPEDVAQEVLENIKDAVQDVIPGLSADEGAGQNNYNPNTPDTRTSRESALKR